MFKFRKTPYEERWLPERHHQSLQHLSNAGDRTNPTARIKERCADCPRIGQAACSFVERINGIQGGDGYAIILDPTRVMFRLDAAKAKRRLAEEVMVIARDSIECDGPNEDGSCGFIPFSERQLEPLSESEE